MLQSNGVQPTFPSPEPSLALLPGRAGSPPSRLPPSSACQPVHSASRPALLSFRASRLSAASLWGDRSQRCPPTLGTLRLPWDGVSPPSRTALLREAGQLLRPRPQQKSVLEPSLPSPGAQLEPRRACWGPSIPRVAGQDPAPLSQGAQGWEPHRTLPQTPSRHVLVASASLEPESQLAATSFENSPAPPQPLGAWCR